MPEKKRVAIIGCGRMGQHYAGAYDMFEDTEIVAIAEYNDARRKVVGERFGVTALYKDANELFKDIVPDLAAVILPGKYIKEAVIAAAEAGVKGVSSDKPIAATLHDADEMVNICEARGVIFHGGNLQRASHEIQETANRLRQGWYGKILGATLHAWGSSEISGGGCQELAVLRLLTSAEVTEVISWAGPQDVLESDSDEGLFVHALFRMSNGLECPVSAHSIGFGGLDIWTENTLIRCKGPKVEMFQGFDGDGKRTQVDPRFSDFPWPRFNYLGSSIRSLISAVAHGSEMALSGHDLRQSLEIAIAAKYSALWGSVPVKLPLADRSLTLYPHTYRWLGGDQSGNPQTVEEARSRSLQN